MTNFPYNRNRPNPPNNPSQDIPDMLQNTQSIDGIIAVDHVGFNSQDNPPGGYHKVIHQVPFSNIATYPPNNYPPFLPSGIGNIGQLVTVQSNDGNATGELLYYIDGGLTNIQMTSNFSPTASATGATFLPGGLIMNWGFTAIGTGGSQTGTVNYTKSYNSFVGSIQLTLLSPSGGSPSSNNTISVRAGAGSSLTNFPWSYAGQAGSYQGFYWMAIGK